MLPVSTLGDILVSGPLSGVGCSALYGLDSLRESAHSNPVTPLCYNGGMTTYTLTLRNTGLGTAELALLHGSYTTDVVEGMQALTDYSLCTIHEMIEVVRNAHRSGVYTMDVQSNVPVG